MRIRCPQSRPRDLTYLSVLQSRSTQVRYAGKLPACPRRLLLLINFQQISSYSLLWKSRCNACSSCPRLYAYGVSTCSSGRVPWLRPGAIVERTAAPTMFLLIPGDLARLRSGTSQVSRSTLALCFDILISRLQMASRPKFTFRTAFWVYDEPAGCGSTKAAGECQSLNFKPPFRCVVY